MLVTCKMYHRESKCLMGREIVTLILYRQGSRNQQGTLSEWVMLHLPNTNSQLYMDLQYRIYFPSSCSTPHYMHHMCLGKSRYQEKRCQQRMDSLCLQLDLQGKSSLHHKGSVHYLSTLCHKSSQPCTDFEGLLYFQGRDNYLRYMDSLYLQLDLQCRIYLQGTGFVPYLPNKLCSSNLAGIDLHPKLPCCQAQGNCPC